MLGFAPAGVMAELCTTAPFLSRSSVLLRRIFCLDATGATGAFRPFLGTAESRPQTSGRSGLRWFCGELVKGRKRNHVPNDLQLGGRRHPGAGTGRADCA